MKPAIIGNLVVIFCFLPLSGRAQQLSGVFDLATADVTFNGTSLDDWSAHSVSSAGDVNGDGLDDVLIGAYRGAPNGHAQAGETYLVYGRDGGATLSGSFDLANADVTFNGIDVNDWSGYSVSTAGDVNGDGLDDILIGVANRNKWAGETYLVYGQDGGATLSGPFDLVNADVAFVGIEESDRSGWSVSTAGDINGDGLDDILIGARWADPNGDSKAGETYLVYGRDVGAPLSGPFDLVAANVTFNGIDVDDWSGLSVSSAGDFNGDGLDDLLIGAFLADPNGNSSAGETYLVYGRDVGAPLSGPFDLATADVTFNGIDASDQSGYSVSSAGDVNGDGLDDLLIGAKGANNQAGETYLVYGRDGPMMLSGPFDLATADVTFNGIDADDFSGVSVSSAGDINGDGLDDILIGAHWADPNGDSKAGETYLVYGRDVGAPLSGLFDLATADVTFKGIDDSDLSGYSVSSAGDINGDGLGDLLIGAYQADPNGIARAGETYLVYGRADTPGIPGDFDEDGNVDGNDFLLWQRDPSVGALADWETNYGTVAPLFAASTTVPEPTSLALLCLGGLLALRRFRRATAFTA